MTAIFKIGSTDFTRLLPESGIIWSRNDLDSEKSARTMDGIMHRSRIAVKRKLSIKCRRMDTETMIRLNNALLPQLIEVTYLDPIDGVTTRTFYGSSVEATTQMTMDGVTYWEGTSFSLIER